MQEPNHEVEVPPSFGEAPQGKLQEPKHRAVAVRIQEVASLRPRQSLRGVRAGRRDVSAEGFDECLGIQVECVPLLEARPELDLGCSCGVARGGLVLTGAAFDLAEVLVGLGRECVEPPLREVIEHRLERRPGRVEFPGPHGPNSHRHARSGVGVRERARPPERHGACDAISSIMTGEELADPEHSERFRGHEWVVEALGDLKGPLGLGRRLGDIAPIDPRPREICPDPALHLWIARRVVQTRMEVAPDEIDLHPRSIRQAPQDVGPRRSSGRRSRHLQEQFLRADRVTGVEEMPGGLDAAANVPATSGAG